MKQAKVLLIALPFLLAPLSRVDAGLVFNLELVGSPIVDTTTTSLTRTINVYAFEDQVGIPPPVNPATFNFSSITLTPINPDPDITFTNNVPLIGNALGAGTQHVTGLTSPGQLIGTISVAVAPTATSADTAGVRFDGTYFGYTYSNGGGSTNFQSVNTVSVTAVPEPGTFGLLGMTGVLLTLRRRRK